MAPLILHFQNYVSRSACHICSANMSCVDKDPPSIRWGQELAGGQICPLCLGDRGNKCFPNGAWHRMTTRRGLIWQGRLAGPAMWGVVFGGELHWYSHMVPAKVYS